MIEQIERFRSKLKVKPLFQRELSPDGEVCFVFPEATQEVARTISGQLSQWHTERRRVDQHAELSGGELVAVNLWK